MVMAELLGNSWIVVTGLIACSVLAILYMLATAVRNQTYMHDLQVNVARLQQQYHARVKAMQEAAQTGAVELTPAEPEQKNERRKAA